MLCRSKAHSCFTALYTNLKQCCQTSNINSQSQFLVFAIHQANVLANPPSDLLSRHHNTIIIGNTHMDYYILNWWLKYCTCDHYKLNRSILNVDNHFTVRLCAGSVCRLFPMMPFEWLSQGNNRWRSVLWIPRINTCILLGIWKFGSYFENYSWM